MNHISKERSDHHMTEIATLVTDIVMAEDNETAWHLAFDAQHCLQAMADEYDVEIGDSGTLLAFMMATLSVGIVAPEARIENALTVAWHILEGIGKEG